MAQEQIKPKTLGRHDILPELVDMARAFAKYKIYARVLLGGSCSLMLQTKHVRSLAHDMDIELISMVIEGVPIDPSTKRFGQIFGDFISAHILFSNSNPMAKWQDISELELAKKVRRGEMRPTPYASIRDAEGFGINFVLMPLNDLIRQKNLIETRRRNTISLSAGRLDVINKHARDAEQLNWLAKQPAARWYQPLAPRHRKVEPITISL